MKKLRQKMISKYSIELLENYKATLTLPIPSNKKPTSILNKYQLKSRNPKFHRNPKLQHTQTEKTPDNNLNIFNFEPLTFFTSMKLSITSFTSTILKTLL